MFELTTRVLKSSELIQARLYRVTLVLIIPVYQIFGSWWFVKKKEKKNTKTRELGFSFHASYQKN